MREEAGVAESAELLRSEEREDDGALRPGTAGECMRERKDGGRAGGVVVGPVVYGVAGRIGRSDAEVIEMRGEEDGLFRLSGGRCCAAKNGDGVPGFRAWSVLQARQALLRSCGQRRWERNFLDKAAVRCAGREAEIAKLCGGEEGRNMLVAGGGASSVEFVVREEGDVRANFSIQSAGGQCCLSSRRVERRRLCRTRSSKRKHQKCNRQRD